MANFLEYIHIRLFSIKQTHTNKMSRNLGAIRESCRSLKLNKFLQSIMTDFGFIFYIFFGVRKKFLQTYTFF